MGKEKECECCHEWWYDSDVKENLCPNCYDYFKQLKQKLAEKTAKLEFANKEIERLKASNCYIHDLHNNLYREYQKKNDELYKKKIKELEV